MKEEQLKENSPDTYCKKKPKQTKTNQKHKPNQIYGKS